MTPIVDTLTIQQRKIHSHQTVLLTGLSRDAVRLLAFGESYFDWLTRLPGIVAGRGSSDTRLITSHVLAIPLLRFAAPYLIAARGGCELRYHIIGGIMAAPASGWLAFGCRAESGGLRLWVDVTGYQPRLGTGLIYLHTQALFHRWITLRFMRMWVRKINQGVFQSEKRK